MKAIIVTQEEPFYLPIFMGKLFGEFREVVAVIILPGIPEGFTRLSYLKRLFDIFGLRVLITYGLLFIQHKILNSLSPFKQSERFYSVKTAARRCSIPVYELKNINSPESLNLLKVLEPEVITSVASPQIFKRALLNLAKYTLNIHSALLPQYRGMMPSFWALAKGEEKTGVTVHYMNKQVDTGNIILQKTIDISPQDTLHSLQTKVANVGATTLLESLEKIKNGNEIRITPQGEGSYYLFPTREAAKEFRARGRRFI